MSRSLGLFIGVLGSVALMLTAQGSFPTTRPVATPLTPTQFPILPWGWTPGDAQALAEIRDCGFNLAGFVAPKDLDLVASAGLQCIVDAPEITGAIGPEPIEDAEIARRVKAATDGLKDHPAVFGYYLRDEPLAELFPNLGRWRTALAQADPDAIAYINLFPYVAQGPILSNYEEYVQRYLKEANPGYLSYDHYALSDEGLVTPTLYQNLEIMRRHAQAARAPDGIPFWNIILSNAHYHYASPTPAGLRLQVYASLAYGAKGISYFTYFTPMLGDFRDAPIDPLWNKTATWAMVRDVNHEIHTLGPTYLQLKSINVFHHPQAPAGCSGDLSSSRHVAELSCESPVLVGEFEHADGRPFVMLVNTNIQKSNAVTITFKQPGKVVIINRFTGKTDGWARDYGYLAPGQGWLLSLEP